MKLRRYLAIPLMVILFLISAPALGSEITGALYTGTLRVTEDGSGDTSNASVNFTLSADSLVANDFATANLTDVLLRLGSTDTAFMPPQGDSPWMMFVDDIDEGITMDYSLYSGNATGGKTVWFPGTNGLYFHDKPELEPGDNYTIELSGYFDTEIATGYYYFNKLNGIGLKSKSANTIALWVNNVERIAVSDLDSGDYTVSISDNGDNLTLSIDGVLQDSVASVSVLNYGDNWYIAYSGAPRNPLQYMEYLEITIDGVQQQYLEWERAAHFTDQSGNGHDTVSVAFRSTATDTNVTAELIDFTPLSQSQAATYSVSNRDDILGSIPGAPSQLYTELEFDTIPGAEAINDVLSEGDTPQALWWFPFLCLFIGIIGLLIYQASTLRVAGGIIGEDSASTGSLLAMCVVIEVLFGIFGLLNPVPFWPAILFPIPAFAIVISQKHWSWG